MTQSVPDYLSFMTRGNDLLRLHRPSEAAIAFADACSMQPNNAEAHVQRAVALFHDGDYETAWKEFEFRHDPAWAKANGWSRTPRDLGRFMRFGRDDGRMTGLLVHAEGGAGDTVQFARFLPLLQDRYPNLPIVFEVQNPLQELIQNFPGFEKIQVISRTKPDPQNPANKISPHLPPSINAQIALLDVPAELGFAYPAMIERHAPPPFFPSREPSDPAQPLKIGLCWRGDPNNTFDTGRDVALALLRPLTEMDDVVVTSLLDDVTPHEHMQIPNLRLPNPSGARVSFNDMAKLIREQDLVISSDTVWPNLAATLGVPTYLLTLKTPNWRWGLNGEQTEWYPSMTLLRQCDDKNWAQPVSTAIRNVEAIVAHRKALAKGAAPI